MNKPYIDKMKKESLLKDPFLNKVDRFIFENKLILKNEKILCGVSGGPDSVALLYVLFILSAKYSIELHVAHLEHGIREKDSVRDQKFVENMCKELNIPFHTKNVKIKEIKKGGESIEETARKERINFFKEQWQRLKCDKLALGHTLDDHIETVIFRLINGTGQKGIMGIKISDNGIIRPLLGVTKKEILNFLDRNSIRYMEDLTNYDVRYTRNRIRNRIIPEMEKINIKYRDHINNFIELVSEDDSFIETIVDGYIKKIIKERDESELRISFNQFYKLHPSIKKRIVLRIMNSFNKLEKRNEAYLSYNVIKSITERIPNSNKILYKDKFITILNEYGELVFKKNVVENVNPKYLYIVEKGTSEVYIREIGRKLIFGIVDKIRIDKFDSNKLYFDLDKIDYPLIIRSRRSGDKINLPNLGFKKIKSIFINDKVKPLERSLIPIILIKEKIAGIFCSYYGRTNRIAKDFMVDGHTKYVMICSLK